MNLIHFSIIFPLVGFVLLAVFRDKLSDLVATSIGIAAVGLSFAITVVAGAAFYSSGLNESGSYVLVSLWDWISVPDLSVAMDLKFDGLALTMMGVITGVGTLIHLFASWYMKGEEGNARFFSYLNLFVACMLVLVLADNLVLLYLGWEGVGICSYLLIGFYYGNRENSKAAIKAFTVTRVGDVFLAIGLFLLYISFDTLSISEIIEQLRVDPSLMPVGSSLAFWTALMLLGGAMGKSAQLPLHTWLADAMAGPTPVSALIHAATMVTAGVYLIARMHPVFLQAPDVLHLVAVIGAVSLLVAGLAALGQSDIKRILAYSTMSQIGYMFLALGVGAWQAAVVHLMSHAFFKALLFLSAGAIIVALHHEQNVFKMGGLWKKLPLVHLCFLVGGGALAALPWITVGFYSKESILWGAYAAGETGLFYAGVIGASITSFYTVRLIYLTFYGEAKNHAEPIKGVRYWLPLSVLLALSTALGALVHPPLAGVLPIDAGQIWLNVNAEEATHAKHVAEIIAIGAGLAGLLLAAYMYAVNKGALLGSIKTSRLGSKAYQFLSAGLGFDALFDALFVRPFLWIGKLIKKDPIDQSYALVSGAVFGLSSLTRFSQNGRLRSYASYMVLGLIVMLVFAIGGLN